MAVRTETRVIDGLEVTTTQLPAMRAGPLYARLGGANAPVPLLATLDPASVGGVQMLFSGLPPDDVGPLVREILASTHVIHEGKVTPLLADDPINRVFSGRFKLLLAVCWFSLQVQFADFFEAASAMASDSPSEPEPAEAASPSTSTKTSRRVRLRGNSSPTGESP